MRFLRVREQIGRRAKILGTGAEEGRAVPGEGTERENGAGVSISGT